MPTLRDLIAAESEITLTVEPEDTPIKGNAMASGDDAADKRAEDSIREQLADGNEWAWCAVIVRGTWRGLSASDSLGCCSYLSEADFRQPNGGYYDDMVSGVIDELTAKAESILECASSVA